MDVCVPVPVTDGDGVVDGLGQLGCVDTPATDGSVVTYEGVSSHATENT